MGLVAFIMAYALFAFIFYILQVIAYWKIFTKAGEEGWKSIIPIYNGYVQYRLTWDVQYFWVALGLAVGGGILNSFRRNCGSYRFACASGNSTHECGGTL